VPSLADSIIFLTLTRLVVVFIFENFSFALFTPPLGDFQRRRRQRLRGFRCTLRRLPLFQVKKRFVCFPSLPTGRPLLWLPHPFRGRQQAHGFLGRRRPPPASFEGLRARGFLCRQRLHSAIVTFLGKEMLLMFLFAFRRSWLTANYTFIFLIALQTHVAMRSTSTAANPHTFLIFLGYYKS
jgi:hypothetical protein